MQLRETDLPPDIKAIQGHAFVLSFCAAAFVVALVVVFVAGCQSDAAQRAKEASDSLPAWFQWVGGSDAPSGFGAVATGSFCLGMVAVAIGFVLAFACDRLAIGFALVACGIGVAVVALTLAHFGKALAFVGFVGVVAALIWWGWQSRGRFIELAKAAPDVDTSRLSASTAAAVQAVRQRLSGG